MKNLVLVALFVFAVTGIAAPLSSTAFPAPNAGPQLHVSAVLDDGLDEDKKKKKKKDGGEEDEEDYRSPSRSGWDVGA